MQQNPLQAKLAAQKQQQQKQEGDLKLQIAQQVAKKKLAILKAKGEKRLQQETELDEDRLTPALYKHYYRSLRQMKGNVLKVQDEKKKDWYKTQISKLEKAIANKTIVERETDKHPVEYYDARERESKAKWHYSRVGKNKNASFKKGIENDYKAQLLRKGVVDSDGKQKPLERKTNQFKQEPFAHDHERKSSHGTKVLHGVSFREEEIAEREIVSGEKYGRANHWYRQHLNRYQMYLKKGDLAKAETHRRKAQEYKRRSYIALDNPEKQLHID
jgi:hypothetical protein